MPLGGRQLALEIRDVVREVHFLDGPGVLDGGLVHLEEHGVLHRAEREVEAGVEDHGGLLKATANRGSGGPRGPPLLHGLSYWQDSQLSGFSREHATFSASVGA